MSRRRSTETIALIVSIALALAACTLAVAPAPEAADSHVTISGKFRNSDIVIGASKRFAGAIDSLTWNGREFINAYDHGRQLQSAVQFNGAGECLNPTEAGSLDDDRGMTSTSQTVAMQADGNHLVTRSRMAYWLAPGQTSPSCRGKHALNREKLSDVGLSKTVTIGAYGLPNVIEHDVTFHIPGNYEQGNFEAITAYMPADFSEFWTFDRTRNYLKPQGGTSGAQPLPVIAATPDGKFAIGVYSADLPQRAPMSGGYGHFRFDKLEGNGNATMKWNCVFREKPVKAGDHRFVCYTIVGSLDDVKSAMVRLAAAARPTRR